MINGTRLKELRIDSGLTLAEVGKEIGCTASFLSQIERGLKEPSLTMLRKLSNLFCEPIPNLLYASTVPAEQEPRPYSIVRAGERKTTNIPGLSSKCEALTIGKTPKKKSSLRGGIYYMVPGSYASEGLISHKFDECVFLISGSLEIQFTSHSEYMEPGDCIYICALTAHNFKNCGNCDATFIGFNN